MSKGQIPWHVKCKAHGRRSKLPCGNWAIRGGFVCRLHGGSTSQVKRRAEERIRLVAEACMEPAIDFIVSQLHNPRIAPTTRLRLAEAILDTVGSDVLGDEVANGKVEP